jgi:hypothetical protein
MLFETGISKLYAIFVFLLVSFPSAFLVLDQVIFSLYCTGVTLSEVKAKKPTLTEPNQFGLNQFLVQSGSNFSEITTPSLVWFLTVTPLTNGMTKFGGREKKKSGGNTVA